MADQRIQATDNMIGANHPTLTDTLNKLTLVAHETDGTHKASLTFTTPDIGVATATSVNKVTITAPATSATLTLAQGSSLITSGANSITLTSTGATNVTLPTTGTLATLTGAEILTNKTLTSPTMTAPALGTPASGILTHCTSLPLAGVTGYSTGTFVPRDISVSGLTFINASGTFVTIGPVRFIMGRFTVPTTLSTDSVYFSTVGFVLGNYFPASVSYPGANKTFITDSANSIYSLDYVPYSSVSGKTINFSAMVVWDAS